MVQVALTVGIASALVMSGLSPWLIPDKTLPLGEMSGENKCMYKVDLVCQEIGFVMGVFPVCAFDALFVGLCVKITVQFRILGQVFKDIDFDGDRTRIVEAIEHHCFLLE